MVGILIVTHSHLGDAFIEAAEFILDQQYDNLIAVSIDLQENAEILRKKIASGIKAVDRQEGVLILTDMFGGTPSNLSYSFLEEGRVEVISGVNLPILVKALKTRGSLPVNKFAEMLVNFGKQCISLASGILKGNKRG